MSNDDSRISRAARRRLLGVGAAGLASCVGAAAQPPVPEAPANDVQPRVRRRRERTAETTEGPFYLDLKLDRGHIAEDVAGIPLELLLQVVDQADRPLAGVRVDIWHCNAHGIYSGFFGQGDDGKVDTRGQTFLRGTRSTGEDGRVRFHTVYPGWYEGRTAHIHAKVFIDGHAVLTTQFFLPDALNEFLYTQVPAYRRTAQRDTLNANDGIAIRAGAMVDGAVRQQSDRYVATLDLVVDPIARSRAEGLPPGFGAGRPAPADAQEPLQGRARGLPPFGPFPGGREGRALSGAERLRALVPGLGDES